MSIFGKIKNAIFGHPAAAATASSAPAATPSPSAPSTPEPAATTAAPVGGTGQAVPSMAGAAPAPGATPDQAQPVDIASILDAAVQKNGQKLDWKHSVVDLMKALGMDASLAERKELADELGYAGDKNDSATMNMWLHKALMRKLSQNGGKVPAELLD